MRPLHAGDDEAAGSVRVGLIFAASLDPRPSATRITVCIDYQAQRFQSRRLKFRFEHAWPKQLLNSTRWLNMDNRPTISFPCNPILLHEIGNYTLFCSAFHEQLSRVDHRCVLPDFDSPFSRRDDFFIGESDGAAFLTINPLNRYAHVTRLRCRDRREAFVAVPAVRRRENLGIQCGCPLADHSPHIFHDRIVKPGIYLIDQQDSSLGIRQGERKPQNSPHSHQKMLVANDSFLRAEHQCKCCGAARRDQRRPRLVHRHGFHGQDRVPRTGDGYRSNCGIPVPCARSILLDGPGWKNIGMYFSPPSSATQCTPGRMFSRNCWYPPRD